MDNQYEEIRKEETSAETVEEKVCTQCCQTVAEAAEPTEEPLKEEVIAEQETEQEAEQDAEQADACTESEQSESANTFETLKERFNSLKENELPLVVDELKKHGYVVLEKSREYAKKLSESGEAYKTRAKAKADEMRKASRREELIFQIGEVAYDGHRNGEDVASVMEYFYRKLDELED